MVNSVRRYGKMYTARTIYLLIDLRCINGYNRFHGNVCKRHNRTATTTATRDHFHFKLNKPALWLNLFFFLLFAFCRGCFRVVVIARVAYICVCVWVLCIRIARRQLTSFSFRLNSQPLSSFVVVSGFFFRPEFCNSHTFVFAIHAVAGNIPLTKDRQKKQQQQKTRR